MALWIYIVLALIVLVLAWRSSPKLRSWIYDLVIVDMTAKWYLNALSRMDDGTHFLDVGIGTGLALVKNLDLMSKKKLKVTGVDYDNDYVLRCRDLFVKNGLIKNGTGEVFHASIYDWSQGPYDAAYFSGSLMIMPDRVGALKHVQQLLRQGGKIFVTQTFEEKPNPIMETIKPFLKFLLTIDFGSVTYEKDFMQTVKDAGLRVIEHKVIEKKPGRSFNLLILQK